MNRSKGSILIATLWILAILFLLGVGLAYRIGLELQMTRYAQARLKLFYVSRSAVSQTMALLLEEGASNSVDSFQEPWSHDESLFKEQPVGEGVFSIQYPVLDEGGKEVIRYGMTDEESRLPLNTAPADVLSRLPDLEEEIIFSIRAWRGDSGLDPEQLTAEDNYYASLERPYTRKEKPFETLEELLLVRGMEGELFEKIAPLLTVYGGGTVNLNTASVEVLVALGLDEKIAEQWAEARMGSDGLLGTEDDYVLESAQDLISPETQEYLGLDLDQQLLLRNFFTLRQTLLSVQSSAFRIQAEGRLPGQKMVHQVTAVVERSEEKMQIRYWHEK